MSKRALLLHLDISNFSCLSPTARMPILANQLRHQGNMLELATIDTVSKTDI